MKHTINIGNKHYNYESRIIQSPIKYSTHTQTRTRTRGSTRTRQEHDELDELDKNMMNYKMNKMN
jgi:hypothetical protein